MTHFIEIPIILALPEIKREKDKRIGDWVVEQLKDEFNYIEQTNTWSKCISKLNNNSEGEIVITDSYLPEKNPKDRKDKYLPLSNYIHTILDTPGKRTLLTLAHKPLSPETKNNLLEKNLYCLQADDFANPDEIEYLVKNEKGNTLSTKKEKSKKMILCSMVKLAAQDLFDNHNEMFKTLYDNNSTSQGRALEIIVHTLFSNSYNRSYFSFKRSYIDFKVVSSITNKPMIQIDVLLKTLDHADNIKYIFVECKNMTDAVHCSDICILKGKMEYFPCYDNECKKNFFISLSGFTEDCKKLGSFGPKYIICIDRKKLIEVMLKEPMERQILFEEWLEEIQNFNLNNRTITI